MADLIRWKRQLKSTLLVHSALCETLRPASSEDSCRRAGHARRESFWSPSIIVVTFLLQVIDGAKTLRAAVAVLLAQLAMRGDADLPSPDPAACCQARQRLPGEVFPKLLTQTAEQMIDLTQELLRAAWAGTHAFTLADLVERKQPADGEQLLCPVSVETLVWVSAAADLTSTSPAQSRTTVYPP